LKCPIFLPAKVPRKRAGLPGCVGRDLVIATGGQEMLRLNRSTRHNLRWIGRHCR